MGYIKDIHMIYKEILRVKDKVFINIQGIVFNPQNQDLYISQMKYYEIDVRKMKNLCENQKENLFERI